MTMAVAASSSLDKDANGFTTLNNFTIKAGNSVILVIVNIEERYFVFDLLNRAPSRLQCGAHVCRD